MNFTENVKLLIENLENLFRTETVVGKPIKIDNITLVPIISISFGAGGGSGDTKDDKNNNRTGGAGFGGKIVPYAILIIKDNDVNVITFFNEKNSLDKILNIVPDILSKINFEKDNNN